MMDTTPFEIHCEHLSRRFNYEWIFREFNFTFQAGHAYAILGPNGSGKSTLLQTITGFLHPTTGSLQWKQAGSAVSPDKIYRHFSLAAPYLELIEEFTLEETIRFYTRFKPLVAGMGADALCSRIGLQKQADKQIRYFSSGMKQRLKLALAIYSEEPVLVLDEPVSNLDEEGVAWYQELIGELTGHKLVLVGSNNPREYAFCDQQLRLTDFK